VEANKREVLSFEELQRLANTPTEASEVRRAFLFCSYTGLAWVDLKALTWENVNLKENFISIVRSKLEKYNRKIEVPLNETAIKLMGEPGKKKDAIFELPTANGANKSLKLWVARAKIDKHITWHCGRHGLDTSLIKDGTGIYEIGNMLGHASLKYTKRYLHDSREQNQKDIDSLPKIKL
jgi:integrase/recombinase XerD